MLWEQDLFKDALEHVAFKLNPDDSRHARENANPPPEGFRRDPGAKKRGWQHELLSVTPGTRGQDWPWLPLGRDDRAAAKDESAGGLPLWIFSPWNVPPHGSACAGQWAVRPPPVMIGHLVGCTSKHLMMRQLGWWHYEVSAADALLAAEGTVLEGAAASMTPWERAEQAGMAAQAAGVAVTAEGAVPRLVPDPLWGPIRAASRSGGGQEASRQARAFPGHARVLVLRGHGLRMATPRNVGPMWDTVRRFSLLALALGRRAVLPLVPCELAPCAPRVPNPLRPSLSTISLGDPRACREGPSAGIGSATDLVPRSVDSPLGWSPSPDTSRWWGGRARRQPHDGCCQPIPHFGSCIDPAGARRPLGTEPLISTADLARFMEEIRRGTSELEMRRTVHVARLSANWTDDSLHSMHKATEHARVLVVDAQGVPAERLPAIDWLIAHAGVNAAEESIGSHAARCFSALARG